MSGSTSPISEENIMEHYQRLNLLAVLKEIEAAEENNEETYRCPICGGRGKHSRNWRGQLSAHCDGCNYKIIS